MGGQDEARRVVLHLGMHKTGTSSIQAAFQGYRDERIEYADLGPSNHSLILQRAFEEGGAGAEGAPAITPAKREAARKALTAVLRGSRRSVILSGEGLSHFDRASARRCVEFLRPHVDRVQAILYVRAPASYARSAFQERTKFHAATFDVGHLVRNYRERAARWSEALGEEPTYVLYDRETLHGGDVVEDFAWRLGLDPAWARSRAREQNVSLTAEGTAVLYLMRHVHGPVPGDRVARARQRHVAEALAGFGTRRLAFAPEVMRPGLEARAADIAWMEERLGRPFPPESDKGAVVFASEREMLDFAEEQAGALEAHLRAKGLYDGPPGRGTVELLDAVASGMAVPRREAASPWSGPRSLLRSLAARLGR